MPTANSSKSFSNVSVELKGTQMYVPPILDPLAYLVIIYLVGIGLVILTGLSGILSNIANICVYLKMDVKETTNMKFFALSVSDLLVCMSTVVVHTFGYPPISFMTMPSGALWTEVSLSGTYVAFPCLGCSAWVTALLSVERYLCIATPLKVKEIITPQRTRFLILVIVAYQSVFLVLFFVNPGPPYTIPDDKRTLYYNCSFSGPTFICFFIVSISTVLLVFKIRRSLEWRNESSAQSKTGSGNTKEKKATRSVLAICLIFIVCFSVNIGLFLATAIYPTFTHFDPYLGTLFVALYAISTWFQVICSSVNMLVYYFMSTKYREVFESMFWRRKT